MPPAARPPTMQDVAQAIGVHKSTVQRALAGDPRIEAGTVARVRTAAARLGYDPERHLGARRLALRRSGGHARNHLLALFFPPGVYTSPFFMRLYAGIMDELGPRREDLVTSCLVSEDPLRLPACVRRGDVDAVMALGHAGTVEALAGLIAAQAGERPPPLVSLVNPGPFPSVAADVAAGAAWALGHLLDLGHRRVLAVDGMAHRAEARAEGWRRACAERGLELEAVLERVPADRERPGTGLAAILDEALARRPDATAILAGNDPAAIAIAGALAARGLRVPEDLSLIGFDDSHPLPDAAGANRLTTVAVPLEELGRAAARLALDLAEGRAGGPLVLPTTPQLRATTAPPRR